MFKVWSFVVKFQLEPWFILASGLPPTNVLSHVLVSVRFFFL